MLTETCLAEIETWNRGGNYDGRPGEAQRDIGLLVAEVRRLQHELGTEQIRNGRLGGALAGVNVALVRDDGDIKTAVAIVAAALATNCD